MYTIRKTETFTVYEASEPVQIDPEKFRNLSKPYNGNTESEFIGYLASFFPYDIPEDLDEDTKEILVKLDEGITIEYANSLEKGSNQNLQIGEVDLSYTKSGGFRVEDEVKI